MRITRREFLKSAGALAAMGLASGWPRMGCANVPTDNRFVFVILRGAMDGLAAVAPYGDPNYRTARGGLALNNPGQPDGLLDLNGYFGLNPGMQPLMPLYQQRQMLVVHAVASPYRERSHFDAQNVLENGTTHANGTDGWLNRALQVLSADPSAAIAINQQVPLVLQGKMEVASWSPKGNAAPKGEYLEKIGALYQRDPLLADAYGEAMKAQALASQALTQDDKMANKAAKPPAQLYVAAQAMAAMLKAENGPRVAVLEAGGWDTHVNQGTGTGQLYNRLGDLATALAVIAPTMGDAWKKTVVVVATEFGRTVAQNGTGGTDHGTGGMMLVMGGNINGGNVLTRWPGLAENQLYQGRDLMPTVDMRSVFKTVLYSHLQTPNAPLESVIFPGSQDAGLIKGLMA